MEIINEFLPNKTSLISIMLSLNMLNNATCSKDTLGNFEMQYFFHPNDVRAVKR